MLLKCNSDRYLRVLWLDGSGERLCRSTPWAESSIARYLFTHVKINTASFVNRVYAGNGCVTTLMYFVLATSLACTVSCCFDLHEDWWVLFASWPGADKLHVVLACCLSAWTHTCVADRACVADNLLDCPFGSGESNLLNQSPSDYIGVTIDPLRSRRTPSTCCRQLLQLVCSTIVS